MFFSKHNADALPHRLELLKGSGAECGRGDTIPPAFLEHTSRIKVKTVKLKLRLSCLLTQAPQAGDSRPQQCTCLSAALGRTQPGALGCGGKALGAQPSSVGGGRRVVSQGHMSFVESQTMPHLCGDRCAFEGTCLTINANPRSERGLAQPLQ